MADQPSWSVRVNGGEPDLLDSRDRTLKLHATQIGGDVVCITTGCESGYDDIWTLKPTATQSGASSKAGGRRGHLNARR